MPTNSAGKSSASSATPKPVASTWRTHASPSQKNSLCFSQSLPLPWLGPTPVPQPSSHKATLLAPNMGTGANPGSEQASTSSGIGFSQIQTWPYSDGDLSGEESQLASTSPE